MANLLYAIAIILTIGWIVAFFGFHAGNFIHALPLIALIALILRVTEGGDASRGRQEKSKWLNINPAAGSAHKTL